MPFSALVLDETARSLVIYKMRWWALACQILMIVGAIIFLEEQFPLISICFVILCGIGMNAFHVVLTEKNKINEWYSFLFLCFDLLQWTILLSMIGAIYNPFTPFLVVPVVFSVIYMRAKYVVILNILMLLCISVLVIPAWIVEPSKLHITSIFKTILHYSGMNTNQIGILNHWLIIVAIGTFFGWGLRLMRHEAKKYLAAQKASGLAYQEYTRVAAIGTMAAAAVHELGTPLNTLHLIATELAVEVDKKSSHYEDITIMAEQIVRCRTILQSLSKMSYSQEKQKLDGLGISLLLEQIAQPYQRKGITFKTVIQKEAEVQKFTLLWSNEWTYGIGNILQNAFQFAKSRVTVSIDCKKNFLFISIMDDGRGFSKDVLQKIGEPYNSGRAPDDKGSHMGLGLFIAKSLLEQTGATIDFANNRSSGANVTVVWKITRNNKRSDSHVNRT